MAAGQDITPREIEAALRQRVDSLVPLLLKGAARTGRHWTVGSVAGEPGTQMKIERSGVRQGCWRDFSADEGSDEGRGDMLKLIAAVHFGGWRVDGARAKAIAWALSWLGWSDLSRDTIATIKRDTAKRAEEADALAKAEADKRHRQAAFLWGGAVPIKGTPAQRYLEARGIDFARLGRLPGSLRYMPDCWCQVRRGKHPAMIARIGGLNGDLLAVHRTYLDVSLGKHGPVGVVKIGQDPATKRLMLWRPGLTRKKSHKASLGSYGGGHIALWKGTSRATLREVPRGTPVYVSEGIEDGLTIALARPEARVVAGVALANMGGLDLPPQAGPLIFIGQHDAVDGKAIEAFERAIARQQEAADQAQRPRPQIIWPEPGFKDFNDQLRGIRMAEPAHG